MIDERRCDGQTFLGFTVVSCDRPATHHVYVDAHEQYDFCDRHYFFDQHGYYPENAPDTSEPFSFGSLEGSDD